MLLTEALLPAKMHKMSFGGRAPFGPAGELKCSIVRHLSRGREKVGIKEGKAKRMGEER